MKLTYLGHSAYLLELDQALILFDYGSVPQRRTRADGLIDWQQLPDKPLLGISTHHHADHYWSRTQEQVLAQRGGHYLVGMDTPVQELSAETPARQPTLNIGPRQTTRWGDWQIAASGSTDAGISLFLRQAGHAFYYGGDLAVWDVDDFFRTGYRDEMAWLKSQFDAFKPLKLAFYPVGTSDGWQEDQLLEGVKAAVSWMKPEIVVPMHAHNYEAFYPRFANWLRSEMATENWRLQSAAAGEPVTAGTILVPERPGDCFEIA